MKIMKKMLKKYFSNPIFVGVAVVVMVGVVIGIVLLISSIKNQPEKEILTQTSLEKIINVSELSTFETIYNGITKVMNEKKADKVDYYVNYEAKVKAGIDFNKLNVSVDNDAKKISVTIPPVEITDVNVDITTLDFIFYNDKANTETVVQEAYNLCIEDVAQESKNKNAIYELAEQNVKNTVEALLNPFIKQLDSEYILEIK